MDQEHESHCRKCYNFKNCIKLNSLQRNEPNPVISCPIVKCRFKCTAYFHACKEDEHILLCENIKVPCINVEYGCGLLLERKKRANHLETCPASVIVCKMEWNRWPLVNGEKRAFDVDVEENDDQLDVAFLKHDEKTLREWEKNLPKNLRKVLRDAITEKHPVMPLAISGLRIPHCIATENLVEKLITGHSGNNSNSDHSERDESSHAPMGLASSVCKKLVGGSSDSNNNNNKNHSVKNNDQNSQASLQDALDKIKVNEKTDTSTIEDCTRLSLVLNIIPKSKLKPRNIYTFMCGLEFRRDEFGRHFHQVHGEIASCVDGWLFKRCPMETRGCGFGIHRLFPHDKNYRIVHSDVTFCTTQIISNHPESNDGKTIPVSQGISLCDLPFEILVHLTKFLDSLSLGNVSMTCTLLRDVCEFVVEKRGIVALQWEKNLSGWEVCSKKWLFSTAFSPIRKWSWNELGTISNHMQNCTHFDKNVASQPFSYTNGITDAEIFDAVR